MKDIIDDDFFKKIKFKPKKEDLQVSSNNETVFYSVDQENFSLMGCISKIYPEESEKYKQIIGSEDFGIDKELDGVVFVTYILKQRYIETIKQEQKRILKMIKYIQSYIDKNKKELTQEKLRECELILGVLEKNERENQILIKQEISKIEELKATFDSNIQEWINIDAEKRNTNSIDEK